MVSIGSEQEKKFGIVILGNGVPGEMYLGDLVSESRMDIRGIEILRVDLGASELLQTEKRFLIEDFELKDATPNPFNPKTKISFRLPQRDLVNLSIFDIAGRQVLVLIDDEYFESGEHQVEWNGLNGHGSPAAAGIYFYCTVTVIT